MLLVFVETVGEERAEKANESGLTADIRVLIGSINFNSTQI